jgi:hypothetical protein
VKLPPWHRALVYAAVALLTATGAGWLVCHYLLAESGEYGPVPHPLEGPWLALHGAAGMLALFVFGSLLTTHMIRAWMLRRSRLGGGTLAGVILVLALGGLGLYYVADDTWRAALSLSHWALGLALPALVVLHARSAREVLPLPQLPPPEEEE